MKRSTLVPSLLLSLGISALWLTARAADSCEAGRVAIPSAASSPSVRRDSPPDRIDGWRNGSRQEVGITPEPRPEAPGEARSSPTPSFDRVRVHGLVRFGGRPVDDFELSFHAAGEEDEEDWDFTDDDGGYEVWLPAARYTVRNDEDGSFVTEVAVPAYPQELVLDIDLVSAPPAGE